MASNHIMETIMRILLFLITFVLVFCAVTSAQEAETGPARVIGTVNRIDFTGNTALTDEQLQEAVPVKPGELLTAGDLQRISQAVTQAYRERGYLAVVGENILEGFEQTGVLTVPVVEAKVTEVRIEGLRKTRESTLRRFLELRPGDLYSVPALRRDARRLIALGVFEQVDANLEAAEEPGGVIIVWMLQEREKTGYVTFRGTYSPQDKLVGSIILTQSNFRGRLEQVRLSSSIGSIEGRLSWELFYHNPLVAPRTSLSASAFDRVRYRFSRSLVDEPDVDRYFERREGGRLLTSRRLSDVRRLDTGFRYENVDVRNFPADFMVPDIPPVDGRVTSISAELVEDNRDSVIYPTTGRFHRVALEPAYVDSDDSNWIAKWGVEWRRFIALDEPPVEPAELEREYRPRVIALRALTGSSLGELPFFEQYFLGGIGGLRGYLEDRFWGKHVFLVTGEYRQPIGRSVTALAFVDVGDAWGSDFQFLPDAETDFRQHDSLSPRVGAGIGVRYVSDYGSLGIDFAWGEEFRTHLVLGETF